MRRNDGFEGVSARKSSVQARGNDGWRGVGLELVGTIFQAENDDVFASHDPHTVVQMKYAPHSELFELDVCQIRCLYLTLLLSYERMNIDTLFK